MKKFLPFISMILVAFLFTSIKAKALDVIDDGGGGGSDGYSYVGTYPTYCTSSWWWAECYQNKVYVKEGYTYKITNIHDDYSPGDIKEYTMISSNYTISAKINVEIEKDFKVLKGKIGFEIGWESSKGVATKYNVPSSLQSPEYRIAFVTLDTYQTYKTIRYYKENRYEDSYSHYDDTYYTDIYKKDEEWVTWHVKDKYNQHLFYYGA